MGFVFYRENLQKNCESFQIALGVVLPPFEKYFYSLLLWIFRFAWGR